jgi:hypothetical protein
VVLASEKIDRTILAAVRRMQRGECDGRQGIERSTVHECRSIPLKYSVSASDRCLKDEAAKITSGVAHILVIPLRVVCVFGNKR